MIKCSLSSGEKAANGRQKKRKKGSIYSIVILGHGYYGSIEISMSSKVLGLA
jgi:hypothetical protein